MDDSAAVLTFPQFVRAAASAYGDSLAISLKGESIPDDSITFAQLDEMSQMLARGLIARGVGKGTRVGFIHGNGPWFALILAAISRVGGVAIPLSTLIRANELVRVLRQSDVSTLVVQRKLLRHDYVERLCEALPELRQGSEPDLRISKVPYLRTIVSSGGGLPPTFRDLTYLTEAAASVSTELLREVEAEVHPSDQMLEIYTSGSMALPKGVKHTHGAVVFRSQYIASKLQMRRGVAAPVFMPMFWVGGLMTSLLPAWTLGAITTCTESTPTDSRFAMGSVMSKEDLKAISDYRPYWALGMTETLGPYSLGDEQRAPGYPLCSPLDHVADRFELRVWADGHEVADGKIGEIQVRGYALTPGLHKVEQSEYFEADGFYRTGDRGLVQGKRVLYVGRDGDMIKTSSSNVSPAEVELELQQLEGVDCAFVVGLPDKERGQVVVAAVAAKEGRKLDFKDIEAQLRLRLSSFKVPRIYVPIIRADVPLLHSNKIARRQMENMLAQLLGRT